MLRGVYQKIPRYSTWGSSMELRKKEGCPQINLYSVFYQCNRQGTDSMGMMKKTHNKGP